MPVKSFFTIFLLITTIGTCFSQEQLILQHQKRNKRQKDFPIERSFSFKINDSTYHYGRITHFDHQYLTITARDSTSAQVLISDIRIITRDRVDNTRWMEPFAYFLIGAGMTIAITPILWIAEGGDKALEGLEFAGILTAVSVPPLWYGSRQERYNLMKKWKLEVK